MAQAQRTKGRATSVDEQIGLKLRQRRTILGISQEKLAESLGVTFQQIQKYENGANRISASRLNLISQVLSVPFSYFFDDADKKNLSENADDIMSQEHNILQKKETLELIRIYYSIKNPKLRKDVFNLVKSMAESVNIKEKAGIEKEAS